jgi:hypothetical protein
MLPSEHKTAPKKLLLAFPASSKAETLWINSLTMQFFCFEIIKRIHKTTKKLKLRQCKTNTIIEQVLRLVLFKIISFLAPGIT